MKLKKLNAVLGLLLAAVCLTHITLEVYYGTTLKDILKLLKLTAHICGGICFTHALISVYMVFFVHERPKRGTAYPKENIQTLIQRLSAAAMFILLFFHTMLSKMLTTHRENGLWFFIICITVAILFFATVFLHISVSFTRALITLGLITSRETQRKIDRVLWVLMILGFLAASILLTRAYYHLFNLPNTGGVA